MEMMEFFHKNTVSKMGKAGSQVVAQEDLTGSGIDVAISTSGYLVNPTYASISPRMLIVVV